MRKENEEANRDEMRIPTTELSDIDDVVQRCGICDVTFGCFAVVVCLYRNGFVDRIDQIELKPPLFLS